MSIEHPLLERMVGHWVLRGTIARQSVVHDVEADWILAHHYLRIHEVSRETDKDGKPEYEALVFLSYDKQQSRFSCLWLDVFGGLSIQSLGVASPKGNELPFLFTNEKGDLDLRNVFAYTPEEDAWEWRIDNIEKGRPKEFARVRLARP